MSVPFHSPNGCSFKKPFFFFTTPDFLSFRYWHTIKRNVGNKEIWSQEELEHYADDWATEFVQTNLPP
jgi:hypothetical protein